MELQAQIEKPSPMDDPLWETVKETMDESGVQGVLIADKTGLCIARDGNVPSGTAGVARSIAIQGSSFFSKDGKATPLIVIETEDTRVLIKSQSSGITSVVHKSK